MIVATTLAPKHGADVISAREIFFSTASTFAALEWFRVTMCRAPIRSPYRPKFLEKDCATANSSVPFEYVVKWRIAQASLSASPVAKPWLLNGLVALLGLLIYIA